MVAADTEAVGVGAVRVAVAEITRRAPAVGERMRLDQTARSASTGGGAHWCVAYQLGQVTNPADTTGTRAPRVSAQLTVQRRDSERILFALHEGREAIEEAVGHHLSWLPGGEAGGKLRSIVRSWRPLDDSSERLGEWMAEELLRLRTALHPRVRALGLDLP